MKSPDPRIAFFDTCAATWDSDGPPGQAMTDGMAAHADLLTLRPGDRLLEVGCGTGKTTAWLAQQVSPARVTAVDFSPRMIAAAVAKGIDADFLCRDICRDDLGRDAYDVILCFHCFPHFRDQAGALRLLAAALAPRGRLLVMHLAGSEQINAFHASIDGAVRGDRLPAAADWPALLDQAGLEPKALIDREDLFFLEAAPRSP